MSSFASILASHKEQRMGRPRAETIPEEKANRLKVLSMRLLLNISVPTVARRLKCSESTVHRYQREARTYPEAAGILELANAR